MPDTNVMTHPTPHTHGDEGDCCTDSRCASGLRNNYFDGKRLTTDSFRVEQRYMLERRRLLNRAIHGWGVVYGYRITWANGKLKIRPGLALDTCGRELLQVGKTTISFEDVVRLDNEKHKVKFDDALRAAEVEASRAGSARKICWLLSAHYAEKYDGHQVVNDPCRCEHEAWDHTCETVRYSLQPIPCDECCKEWPCELKCGCGEGPCCEHCHDEPRGRGGCRCLCDHLLKLDPSVECCCKLSDIKGPCDRARVDLHHGVPLACVSIEHDRECDRWGFGERIDPCGPRRLVKRNDLLFDLIRGCDLTHISEIGWEEWHRRSGTVPFQHYSDAFGDVVNVGPPGPRGWQKKEAVSRRFFVRFSRPVQRKTVRPDCFVMRVMAGEVEGGWREEFRAPITRLEFKGFEAPGHSPDLVVGAGLVFEGHWVTETVRGGYTRFTNVDRIVEVELEVRGDFIVDCNGQTVDANGFGVSPKPKGNGVPGGTFLSTFSVSSSDETNSAGGVS